MNASPLPFPVEKPFWAMGKIKISREELREILGQPHFIETDDFRTFGGEEDWWAFTLESGTRMLVVLRVPYEDAILYSDPALVLPLLGAIGIAPEDPRVQLYDRPYSIDDAC